ncbi:type II toxin-antitoxin system RelE/ParE family toxin [Gloeobacter violaceus]|uniref:Gsr0166 protein n=1 Tax=Gloeobacter violaceus (strain ATCC 29082 / PCC 7421) TaxID=251221 RepID=Q7NP91_GLOVI|nr:type II toxin-antitoxin system RelE/ParE family toxin [Gloeobacter violaceus]BAC88107.1 gsr0166 [Gloeobacter violaceus PCC 7421]
MTRFNISEQAERDLTEIRNYIARDNIEAADRLIDGFFEAFERIATMPNAGHRRTGKLDPPGRRLRALIAPAG